jgi:hypothetical protein
MSTVHITKILKLCEGSLLMLRIEFSRAVIAVGP